MRLRMRDRRGRPADRAAPVGGPVGHAGPARATLVPPGAPSSTSPTTMISMSRLRRSRAVATAWSTTGARLRGGRAEAASVRPGGGRRGGRSCGRPRRSAAAGLACVEAGRCDRRQPEIASNMIVLSSAVAVAHRVRDHDVPGVRRASSPRRRPRSAPAPSSRSAATALTFQTMPAVGSGRELRVQGVGGADGVRLRHRDADGRGQRPVGRAGDAREARGKRAELRDRCPGPVVAALVPMPLWPEPPAESIVRLIELTMVPVTASVPVAVSCALAEPANATTPRTAAPRTMFLVFIG